MPKHTRCIVGVCDNDKRYPERMVKHSNVTGEIVMHKLPNDKVKRKAWINQVKKGRKNFEIPKNFFVCSNHFVDGEPTPLNPNPTLFLTLSTNNISTPKKRKLPYPRKKLKLGDGDFSDVVDVDDLDDDSTDYSLTCEKATNTEYNYADVVPMQFEQLTRESNIVFFTGLAGTEMFKTLYEYLLQKALVIKCWDGSKKTCSEVKKGLSSVELTEGLLTSPHYDLDPTLLPILKSGLSQKLNVEQELLMVLMKLRLGIMVENLAFRFKISAGKVSQIFITWMKLMSKELGVLVIWPTSRQVKATLPDCFKKLFPNVRVIIDCTEIFMETPSSLVTQACLYSDYKHHCTAKFLVSITPNGAISWVSPVYGRRSSDVFIV